ncbi:biotin--acetyl-CoA-carboxylase ligase [Bifidobacterium aerophilum]|uniref:Biotin--acetyl-CoA-carboxylase ligase n=2 Tax=Bifidobacterium aerophilum TaxID=1798155 RepID=A0A6N9Z6W6_9BIFI|nr:biotin--acetyl-CoA-carboxylase ligase [Bifidobacterium aerophilum]
MISMTKATAPRLGRTERIADKVVAEAELGSTHALARDMVSSGDIARTSPHGIPITVCAADRLTNALVRFGRTWVNQSGNSFTMTFVVVIPESVADDEVVNGWLPMIAGLSALDALEGAIDEADARPFNPECGFQLKWPNDIYCHGLKIGVTATEVLPLPDAAGTRDEAGESSEVGPAAPDAEADPVDGDMAVVFSVGINLTMPASSLPTAQATSLQMHVGPLPPVSELRDMIAERMVDSLRARLTALVAMPMIQASRLRSEMRHVCWMMGRTVHAQLIDGSAVRGEVVALNDDASLSIRTADGETRALLSSEVSLLD